MKNNYDKQIGILDWLIFCSIFFLIIMVYVPLNVWEEENHYKKIRRERMRNIADAQEFFYELTGNYTEDHKELFNLVEAAMDSLIADSTFTGKQVINIDNKSYDVNLDESFHTRVDTTYSIPEVIKVEVTDTLFKIGMINAENPSLVDTLWINSNNFLKHRNDPKFKSKYITHYEDNSGTIIEVEDYDKNKEKYISENFIPKKRKLVNRIDKKINYIRKKFHLNSEMIFCPISRNNIKNKKFIFNIDKTDENSPIFIIESPISKDDNEWRYGIFSYKPGNKETIIGGVQSWAGE